METTELAEQIFDFYSITDFHQKMVNVVDKNDPLMCDSHWRIDQRCWRCALWVHFRLLIYGYWMISSKTIVDHCLCSKRSFSALVSRLSHLPQSQTDWQLAGAFMSKHTFIYNSFHRWARQGFSLTQWHFDRTRCDLEQFGSCRNCCCEPKVTQSGTYGMSMWGEMERTSCTTVRK